MRPTDMSNCRSGCLTQDHASWGECARAANLRVAWLSSTHGMSRAADRATTKELYEYRDLRAQGIQPAGTGRRHIEDAKRISDETGKPYNAEKNPPGQLLTDKRVIKSAQEAGML